MAGLEEILQRHPIWRGGSFARLAAALPSGYGELDRELPGGGWPTGGLTELCGSHEGIGELALLMPALARLTAAGKRVLWLAPPHLPYAPALAVAAESSRAFAVLFRPPAAAHEASPAALRLALEPAGGALALRILKRRGAPLAAPLHLVVKRPFHALGRAAFPLPLRRDAPADRRVGLPVHA